MLCILSAIILSDRLDKLTGVALKLAYKLKLKGESMRKMNVSLTEDEHLV